MINFKFQTKSEGFSRLAGKIFSSGLRPEELARKISWLSEQIDSGKISPSELSLPPGISVSDLTRISGKYKAIVSDPINKSHDSVKPV